MLHSSRKIGARAAERRIARLSICGGAAQPSRTSVVTRRLSASCSAMMCHLSCGGVGFHLPWLPAGPRSSRMHGL
eukprot:15301987-Alexandrium_andersonii.AAC.1